MGDEEGGGEKLTRQQSSGLRLASSFLCAFLFCSDEGFEFGQFLAAQRVGFEEALNHRRERAVEGVLESVKQLAALRLCACNGGTVKREIADFLRREQVLGHHAVHERPNGGISPFSALEKFLLNGRRGAGFVFPDGLDDGPFRLGQFDFELGHGRFN